MTRAFQFVFYLISFTITLTCMGQHSLVIEKGKTVNLNAGVIYFEDTLENLTIHEVVQQPKGRYITSKERNFSYYLTDFPLWFKFKLINHTGDRVYLKIVNPRLDTLELFYQNPVNKKIQKYVYIPTSGTKQLIPFSPTILWDLPYCGANISTYYLRLKSRKRIIMPMAVGSAPLLMNSILLNTALDFSYFGLITVMILFNISLAFLLKSRVYLLYICFLVFTCIFILQFKGYNILLPDPFRSIFSEYSNTFASLGTIFMIFFAIDFLKIREYSSKIYYYLCSLSGFSFIVICLELSGYKILSIKIISYIFLVTCASLIVTGAYSYYKGLRHARFYLLASGVYQISAIIFILPSFKIFPLPTFVSHILPLGHAIDTVLLAVALADRISELRIEKEKVFNTSLEKQKELNEELTIRESELANREYELKEANKYLHVLNQNLIDKNGQLIDNQIQLFNSLEETRTLNVTLLQREEELTSIEEELRQSMDELNNANKELFLTTQNLSNREQELTAIIDSTPDLIISVDKNLNITSSNKNFKDFYRRLVKKEFHDRIKISDNILNEDLRITYNQIYEKVLGGSFQSVIIEHSTNGKRWVSEEYFNPIRNQNGEVEGFTVFVKDITDKVIAQEELKSAEAIYSSIINSTSDFIAAVQLDGSIIALNAQGMNWARTRIGKPFELGKTNYYDLFKPEYRFNYKSILKEVRAGKSIRVQSEEINPENGKTFSKDDLYNPIFDVNGKVTGAAIFSRDVTEQVAARKKALEDEVMINSVLNSNNNFILSLDRNAIFTLANNSYREKIRKIHGIEIQPGITSFFNLSSHPGFESFYKPIFSRVLEGEYIVETSKTIHLISESEEYLEEYFNPIFDQQGQIVGICIFSQNVSDRIKSQEKIVQSERMLTLAQKIAKSGSWSYDLKNQQFKFSEPLHELLEIPKDILLTRKALGELFANRIFDRSIENISSGIDNGEAFTLEYKLKTSSGVKNLYSIGTPVYDEDGKLTDYYGNFQDISEIRTAEDLLKAQTAELIESSKKTAEYRLMALRSVMNPHFLFNSLNSIQYFITKNEREDALLYLGMFSKLIRSILNSSIANYNSLHDELEILKLYVNLETLRFNNKFKTVFKLDPELESEYIKIPSLLLQPYIENAIIHGLFHKKESGGLLTVSFRKRNEKLLCIVEDNGIGRPKAQEIKKANNLHKSIGMLVTKERIDLINNDDDVSVLIKDLYDHQDEPCGTRVEVLVAYR